MIRKLKALWNQFWNPLHVVQVWDDPLECQPGDEGAHTINGHTYYAPFPHCDSDVLHSPGKCEYCDKYPTRQAERIRSFTAFTDDDPDMIEVWNLTPCPSTKRRSVAQIEQWPGNRAKAP